MMTALAGRMTDPKIKDSKMNVAATMYSAIQGSLPSSASMDSTSSAGVPPMWTVTPSGTSMFLSWSTT